MACCGSSGGAVRVARSTSKDDSVLIMRVEREPKNQSKGPVKIERKSGPRNGVRSGRSS